MPYVIAKTVKFEAAHMLPEHDGKCRRLHGHSWEVVARFQSNIVNISGPKRGMVVDFGDVGNVLDLVVESTLDHYYLNESIPDLYPTSENLARWLYDYLAANFVDGTVHSVTVKETCTASATYYPR